MNLVMRMVGVTTVLVAANVPAVDRWTVVAADRMDWAVLHRADNYGIA